MKNGVSTYVHRCDKGVHGLEFPLSLFSGCKVFLRSLKLWAYRRASKHIGRNQFRHVRINLIFLTGTNFTSIKLLFSAFSLVLWNKTFFTKGLGGTFGQVAILAYLPHSNKEKHVLDQAPWSNLVKLSLWDTTRLWAKEGWLLL